MSRFATRKEEISLRFSQAAGSYACHGSLQAAIADALLAALEPSGVVLDAGCGCGRESLLVSENPAVERVIALDIAPAMLASLPASACLQPLLGDMEAIPLPDHSVDVAFSNFAMQWCESRDKVATEMARVLKPGGRLLFSVPGPLSLAVLRTTRLLHINEFASAEDWATAFMQAGFSDCDFAQKNYVAHFANARELLLALKGIGANTADAPRANHLLGKKWWRQVQAALEAQRQPEGLPLQYDVIFVHASC